MKGGILGQPDFSLSPACPAEQRGHAQLNPGALQPLGRAWDLPVLVNEDLLVIVGRPPASACPVEKV